MKTISLFGVAKRKGFTGISAVRLNSNGYPYITFYGGNGKAQNIYLGQNSANKVEEGDKLTPEMAKDAMVVLTTNTAGETRLKLSLGGNGSSVESLFGIEGGDHSDEVFAAFTAGMTIREGVSADMDNE